MSNLLHIFAQAYNHGEAWIVGDHEGLCRLRDALQEAIVTKQPVSKLTFCSDGEGYKVIVLPLDEKVIEEQLRLPYRWMERDESLAQVDSPMKHPSALIEPGTYKQLMKA